ncbi:MAG: MATE family efflux transporter, partial [Anaerolineales bacterium]|nr:MATE family efflux transporter [Anaerolineales bacterium]
WNIGFAPGFGPEQQVLVADLMRLNLFATLLFSMAGLIIAGLQANQHFTLPAIAPSMYDLGTLVGILILVPEQGLQLGPITLPALGLGIHGLVYGTILGAGLFFSIQLPGLIKYKFRWSPKINLQHPGVRQVLVVLGPRVLTMFFIQAIFIATDNIASRLIEGSVTALVYGWLFMQVPESLIGTAIGTALLPTISEQVARDETDLLQNSLNTTLRVILALTIPAAALLIAGIRPLVDILGFDTIGTDLVVWIARAYTLGLVSYSLTEVTSRTFYAQQNARIPLLTIMLTAGTFILLAIPLAKWLGAPGIALANSTAFSFQVVVMLWLLNRKFPGIARVGGTLRRVVPASLVGSGLVIALIFLLPMASMSLVMRAGVGKCILAAAGIFVLPFAWTEVKLLMKL